MASKNPTFFHDRRPTRRQAAGLARRLLGWYDREKRDLPWRRTRDPYAILVSECMLQQTQVSTVIPYYERFLRAFPTVGDLARAPEQEVLREWAGLGYYDRARRLHAAAQKMAQDNLGAVPRGFAELLFLPGVGRYAAGAVASIAFGAVVPAVDANVVRVLCRVFALEENPAAARVRRGLEELARALIPADRPGDFNQALMELGARVCTPSAPGCVHCPLRRSCKAADEGRPQVYPRPAERPKTVQVTEACAVVRQSGRFLVARRPADRGRYRNMWEFPHVEARRGRSYESVLKAFLKSEFGLSVEIERDWAEIRHQVTHHRILKKVYLCRTVSKPKAPDEEKGVRWAGLEEIGELPLGAPHKRILELLVEEAGFFSS